jgi:CelD/BcsL family acetyltransferase involved in cellulose biosynthesis
VGTLVAREVEDPEWVALVRASPAALPFHHPAWALVLADAYGFKPFALVLVDDADHAVAGLPVVEVGGRIRAPRWISLPFTDLCPPIGADAAFPDLAPELDRARRDAGVASLEIRSRLAGVATQPEAALVHDLHLSPDPERLASSFRSSVRRNIRTAERGPPVVRVASSESDVTEVFYGLQVRMRRRLGLPVQPRRFFRLLWTRMLEPGLGRALLVDVDGQAVAGAVFLTWNGTVVYKYGASDPRYWPLRPNNLLFWEAIKWACESGYERLNFGRTDLDAPSLRRFKLGWATEEQALEYTVFGQPQLTGRIEPPRFVRSVIRRSPPWVVRALGEILYRGAA